MKPGHVAEEAFSPHRMGKGDGGGIIALFFVGEDGLLDVVEEEREGEAVPIASEDEMHPSVDMFGAEGCKEFDTAVTHGGCVV